MCTVSLPFGGPLLGRLYDAELLHRAIDGGGLMGGA